MIIAFGHKARHGKDTAGQALADYYIGKRNFAIDTGQKANLDQIFPAAKIFKFADALYEVCREEYGMKEKDANLLQQVGEGRRQLNGKTYWIDQLAPKIKAWKGVAIVTDVRYINEADWLKSIGGTVVNVQRLNTDGTAFQTDDRDPNFISEVELDGYNYDYYIKAKTGQDGWVGEQAVTLAEYLRVLENEQ